MPRRLLAWAVLVAVASLGWAAEPEVPEYKAKAALLFHFALLTDWPGPERERYRFCTVGRDPFGPYLSSLSEKSIRGSPIEVRRHEYWSQTEGCDVVFVAPELLERGDTSWRRPAVGVVTVSDAPGFARQGGIIELVPQSDRIAFSVNLKAARRNGVWFSSRMLGLAREVIQ